ncbi:hypothetical protein I5M32_02095 [Pedobacter sp. SD-b]|uniref:TANFOR domain-containing protein n=1 Tax=Pedobacter segetis TaxID=2793069 RepID=A0ABS1BFT9_9SPHI|nr:hypothetical protein [Pedobacter segetis]MBK0381739.1 hypothetical protein [Pedobacter segetis]
MKTKWIFLLLLIGAYQLNAFAQVNVSVQILPPYPTKITDYSSNPQLMVVNVLNTSTQVQRIQLRGTVYGDNGIILQVSDSYKSPQPIVLNPGGSISLNGNDLSYFFDYTKINYTGITQSEFISKNGLPEGAYRFCIRAFNYDDNQPISPDNPLGCSNTFSISSLEPPLIIRPLADEEINSSAGQNFPIIWNTPPGTAPQVRYKIRMVELFGDKNPNDALMSATQPYFFEKEVIGNSYIYNPSDPQLTAGRKYALSIQAFDPFNNTPFRNNGQSEVISFTYSQPAEIIATEKSPNTTEPSFAPSCNCKQVLAEGNTKNDLVKIGSIISVGEFKMEVTGLQRSSSYLNGKGKIILPFIDSGLSGAKLNVAFFNLTVNPELRMKSGMVKGLVNPQIADLVPEASSPDDKVIRFDDEGIKNWEAFLSNHTENSLSYLKNSGNSQGFELPLILDAGVMKIGIGRMYFTATQAWFDAASAMDAPEANKTIAFSSRGMCLTQDKLCESGKLYLSNDVQLSRINIKLNKTSSIGNNPSGTFVAFDKNGFQSLAIDAAYDFPSNSLRNAQTNAPLVAGIKAITKKGWQNWIAELTLPTFYVDGMRSIKFEADTNKIYYDHSDFENPTGLPVQYVSEGSSPINTSAKTWRGIFIPKINVKLPEIIKNLASNDDVSIEGSNLIYDDNGFTGTVQKAGNLLSLANGSMGGWYASINQFKIDFFKSAFKTSSMGGKLVLPASGNFNDAKNQLDYSATLSSASNGDDLAYQFAISNKKNIDFNALFMNVDLTNCSIVVEGTSNQEIKATANLNGVLSIANTSNMKIPGVGKVGLPGIHFEGLKLMTYGNFIEAGNLKIALASPQHSLAGFDYNLETAALSTSPDGLGAKASLQFKGNLSLAGSAISCKADATFSISSGIKKENNRIVWTGIGGKIEDITFAGGTDLGPFKLKGAIKYFNKNAGNQIDEGFVGALETDIASMLTVNMRARFGSKSDNQGAFNYFDFNALADFGQTGITFAPPIPVALYGFGGGFYYNMALDPSSVPHAAAIPTQAKTQDVDVIPASYKSDKDPNPDSSPEDLLNFNPAGLSLSPQRGGFGLQATILFGLTSRNTLDADATFSMGFKPGGGVDFVKINGNARILTDVSKPLNQRRGVSTGAGDLNVEYDFGNKVFDAKIGAELGVPNVDSHGLLHVTGSTEFYSSPEGWFIHIGRPLGNTPGPTKVDVFNGLFVGTSYLEVGTMQIDPMPAIPDEVLQLAGMQKDILNNRQPAAPRTYHAEGSNKGLIIGSYTKFGFDDKQFLMFVGTLKALMGFDLSINPETTCNNVLGAGGPGGWYAKGQAYMGAQAKIGIKVNLLLIKGTFNIFDAGAAAIVRAGLPNPSWAEGNVGGYFSILDGAIGGNFNFRFSVGEKCVSGTDALGGLTIISELSPTVQSDDKLDITAVPAAAFNIKAGGDYGPGGYTGGYLEWEDYEHPNKDGSPTKRKFLFDRSCLKIMLNGTDVTNSLKRLDEYSLAYDSQNHLEKNTKYTFKVIAHMKEDDSFAGLPANYTFVKENGKVVEETKEISFTTNNGFEAIPSSEYAITSPLHSQKDVPVKESKNTGSIYLETKKILDLSRDFAYPEGTQYVGRIYKNGVKQGADMPVTMEVVNNYLNDGIYRPSTNSSGQSISYNNSHSKWSIANPGLEKNASYSIVFVAKTPVNSNGNQSTFSTTEKTTTGMVAGELVSQTYLQRTTNIGLINKLSGNEHIIGGFNFKTSAYDTYQNKIDALAISKISNLDHPEQNISSLKSHIQNKNTLQTWIKPVNGIYNIHFGRGSNLGIELNLCGERFSKADIDDVRSNDVFQPDYSKGGATNNIIIQHQYVNVQAPLQNPPPVIANLEQNKYQKLKEFLANRTGLSTTNFQIDYVSAGKETDGWFHCSKTGGQSDDLLDNFSAIGEAIPTELPQQTANGFAINFGNYAGNSINTLSPSSSTILVSKMEAENLVCGDQGSVTFTNPIQKQIDKVVNYAVNWGFNSQTNQASSPVSNANQVATWEAIGQMTTNAINGNLTKPQLPGTVAGIFGSSKY